MSEIVCIDYTNHRGERAKRLIKPANIFYGRTEWHTEKQWLLHAYCFVAEADRDFSMACIHSWEAFQGGPAVAKGRNPVS